MNQSNQSASEPTGWLFKFNNGRKHFTTDSAVAAEIIAHLEENETLTEYTGKDLRDAIRNQSCESNEEIQALREKCEELSADKEKYFRLYESACVELQNLKVNKEIKGDPSFAQAGEILGGDAPVWPTWCTSFETRVAYQQGVADCRVFDAKQAESETKSSQKTPPPLTGRWHHGNGVLVSGSIRIAQWDCDSNPPKEFRDEVLDWLCATLNTAIERFESQRAKEGKRW